MIIAIFSVYDAKAEAYLQPFYSQNGGTAVRAMIQAAMDPEHNFNKFAPDFTLFEIGSFNDSTGELKNLEAKKSYGNALTMVRDMGDKVPNGD